MIRVLDRLLLLVLGLGLVALAVLVPVEVVRALLGDPAVSPWRDAVGALESVRWRDGAVLAVSVGVALLGLALLVLQLLPRRPRSVVLQADVPGVRTATTRRSLQGLLAVAATRAPGVRAADVRVGRRRARVTARTAFAAPAGLDAEVRTHVATALESVRPLRPPRLRVRVREAS